MKQQKKASTSKLKAITPQQAKKIKGGTDSEPAVEELEVCYETWTMEVV